jgi:uncharacterized protein with HEPN domain
MIESCDRAVSFVHELDFAGFVRDDKTKSAIQREIFVLGEAAKQIPEAVKARHVEVDWRSLAGLRDVLAHQYFRVDDAIIWDVAVNELPKLQSLLRAMAATEP